MHFIYLKKLFSIFKCCFWLVNSIILDLQVLFFISCLEFYYICKEKSVLARQNNLTCGISLFIKFSTPSLWFAWPFPFPPALPTPTQRRYTVVAGEPVGHGRPLAQGTGGRQRLRTVGNGLGKERA
jgi:hypothetical protein